MEFIAKDATRRTKKVDVWEFAVPGGVRLRWAGRHRACSMTQTSMRFRGDAAQVVVVSIYGTGGSRPGTPAATARG
jgi:hypothetical protein